MSFSTSFQDLNKETHADEQQSALIRLGQLALSNISPAELMREAALLATHVSPAEYCLIWQLLDDKKNFLLMARSGLEDEHVTRIQLAVEPWSMKGYTLTSSHPVIVEDIHREKRFRTTSLEEAVSAASILVGTVDQPYGVLEVFSRQVQAFSQNDLYFLQNIANIIGMTLHKVRDEEDLVTNNQKLQKELIRVQYMTPSGHFEWDRYEIKNRLMESREKERLSLAQELHDVPIQDLYGLIYQLDDFKEVSAEEQSEKLLEEFKQTLHRVINSLRTICRDLRPPSLSPFGLEVAIRDHMEKFCDQNPNIQVKLELMRDQQVLSDGLRLSLFRIYQQAIHNVERHADATEVYVRFNWDEEMVILEVEDNGKGFEVPQQWMDLIHEDHFGLLGIAERVESIRGKLEIISAPGSGTLIRTLVPRG